PVRTRAATSRASSRVRPSATGRSSRATRSWHAGSVRSRCAPRSTFRCSGYSASCEALERAGQRERPPAGGIRRAEEADVVDELGRGVGARRDHPLELEAALAGQAQGALERQRTVEVVELADRLGSAAREVHDVAAEGGGIAAAVLEVVHLDAALELGQG